ncbi:hypothetical protein [Thalassospira xiamenensis]|uniref:hypothetical protein n=1 Tax=Thalassospira xiamenensis TaxID=220697 RepID=UPI003AA825C4
MNTVSAPEAQSTELVSRESLVPELIFKPGGTDPILDEIAAKARAVLPNADVKTTKGRAEIKSVAYKVAQSKTLLDGLGKDLVADWKNRAAAVDVERRRLREFLDKLKDEVREPLTAWEQAEEARVKAINDRIAEIEGMAVSPDIPITGNDAGWLEERLEKVMALKIDDSFAEFKANAALAKDEAIGTVSAALGHAKERARIEAEERVEAERIAAEQRAIEEKEAAEREAREKAEAEERAKREAEQREAERREWEAQAKQREEAAAKAAAEEAENRIRAEAEEKARQEAEAKAKAEAEEARRAANQEHRRKVNNEALKAIAALGVTDDQAKVIVLAIVSGEIPHVTLTY